MSDIRFNRWLHQSGTGGVYQDSSGRVGIGSSVPTTALDIVGVINVTGNINSTGVTTVTTLNIGTGASISSPATNVLTLGTNSAERLRITSTGAIGIGTNNPLARLQVNGSAAKTSADGALVAFSSNDATNPFQLIVQRSASTDTVPVWSITSVEQNVAYRALSLQPNGGNTLIGMGGGRLGIGSASPQAHIDILGNAVGEITLFVNNTNASGYSAIRLGNSDRATNGDHLVFGGSTLGLRSKTGTAISFEPAGTERARLDSSGSIFVGTYANAYDNPGRFNVSNTSRVSTTSGAYVPSNGGFVDYARFEMISNCVTSFPANNNKIMARNGAPLLINNTRDAWNYYTNLPNYLLGSLTHDCINNSTFTFTLACTMTVFLLRDNGWNAVDLTGWTLIESGGQIGISGLSNSRLYVKTLSAGSNALSNNSAMYFFVI